MEGFRDELFWGKSARIAVLCLRIASAFLQTISINFYLQLRLGIDKSYTTEVNRGEICRLKLADVFLLLLYIYICTCQVYHSSRDPIISKFSFFAGKNCNVGRNWEETCGDTSIRQIPTRLFQRLGFEDSKLSELYVCSFSRMENCVERRRWLLKYIIS